MATATPARHARKKPPASEPLKKALRILADPSTFRTAQRPAILAGSKGAARVGRKRAEPDTSTYEGRLCARLGELVEARGLTPPEFADKIDTSKSMVYHWLSGRGTPPVEIWPKLAKVLRVSVADLLPPK